MREQAIPSRGSRRGAAASREFVQRPARRDGRTALRRESFSARTLFGYVPAALKAVLGILAIIAALIGYRVAASASMFQVRSIDITGASQVSADEIESLTRRAVARTGVWRADLSALSAELSRLPGVRRAIVSRVLPDRLRVRVIERTPVAVVHASNGHFVWVDEEGVALGEMKPSDHLPSFFIRGWNEDGAEDARKENAERVKIYLEAAREWAAVGLSERVSEVNLLDVRDVRAQLAGNDSQIEVRLGSQDCSEKTPGCVRNDLGQRLKSALDVLDQYKQTPRGSSITYVDFQGDRVILGTSSGNKLATAPDREQSQPMSTSSPGKSGKSLPQKAPTESKSDTKQESGHDQRATNTARVR